MAEKTEQPTPKKIRDARKKGQVAHSKEIVSTALLISLFGLFFIAGYQIMSQFQELIVFPTHFYELPFDQALEKVLNEILDSSIWILVPFILVVVIVGIFSNVAHVGPLFAPESVKFDLKKISPIAGFKRIFSMKSLVELIKSVFKIVFLSVLIYWVIKSNLYDLIKIPYCGSSCVIPVVSHLMFELAIVTIIAFLIVAVFDLFYQRYDHRKQLRMTKDEVKREHKDDEGDPEIVGHRKQLHREMIQGGMIEQIKNSSVIVTNPTHLAIGIRYDGDQRSLPIVVIKARNGLAQRVKRIAAREGVPVLENVPLARALYNEAELNNYIPSNLIEPIAEVLKWVARLKREQNRG